ncbi:MAG: thioredoxin-like domain-containing protein [Dehalococcoidia bacterium]
MSDAGETPGASGKSWAGSKAAPAFPDGLGWFNVVEPLELAALKGKVVLLDFWTLGCINCQHVIPDLKRLEAEFGPSLAVIGVHSGKYATEHDDESIREAIRRYGLEHAVVNDPDFDFWNAYGANAWPTFVLIDPAGKLVGGHAGEGVYALLQPIIASLVSEFDGRGEIDRTPLPLRLDALVAATVLSYPGKVLADEAGGRLFIADSGHNRVLVASLTGELQKAIGSGVEGFADGAASEAAFRQPQGLALSGDGRTLFVADTRNHAVRAVDLASGEVTTIAGTGKQLDRLPTGQALGRETALASPWDVVNVGDTLFISVAGVHQIWALDLTSNVISIFAGTSREGIQDGPRRTMATLAQPSGLSSDGVSLFWADPESSSVRMVRIAGEGDVDTIVGTGLFDYGDQDGRGKSAKLQHPQGVTFAAGGLFVSDTYNHKVKMLDLGGALRTLAGSERGRADGEPAEARFDEPGGLSYAAGKLYVADTNNHAVRRVDVLSGEVTTLTLSNLLVAAGPGKKTRVRLPGVEAAPGVSTLRVSITSPGGYHLNSQAPAALEFTVSDARVITVSEPSLRWSSDEASVSFPVPAELREGTAELTATGSIYYCRGGEEALCFIHQVEITLPVTVTLASTAGELRFSYELPGAN